MTHRCRSSGASLWPRTAGIVDEGIVLDHQHIVLGGDRQDGVSGWEFGRTAAGIVRH